MLVQMESVIVGSCYYCYIQEGGVGGWGGGIELMGEVLSVI